MTTFRRSTRAAAAAGALAAASALLTGTAEAADTAWVKKPAPLMWPGATFEHAGAVSSSEVWAVGGQGTHSEQSSPFCLGGPPLCETWTTRNPAMQRWNGLYWRTHNPPGFTGRGAMTRVAVRSASDVWAGGYREDSRGWPASSYVARWNGSAWTEVAPPAGQPGVSDLDVDGSGVWATGGGQVFRWDGSGWIRQDPPVEAASLHVLADDDVWAAGRDKATGKPGVARWNGSSWRLAPAPGGEAGETVADAAARSAEDVWLGLGKYPQQATALVRWDGAAWSPVALPSWVTTLTRVLPTGGGGALAVVEGVQGGTDGRQHLIRYDGSAWHVVPVAPTAPNVNGATLRSLVQMPGTVWGVGTEGLRAAVVAPG
ncbi:hypothetical protein ACIBF1_34680 [Spirillospora sp. NPDC050679]